MVVMISISLVCYSHSLVNVYLLAIKCQAISLPEMLNRTIPLVSGGVIIQLPDTEVPVMKYISLAYRTSKKCSCPCKTNLSL